MKTDLTLLEEAEKDRAILKIKAWQRLPDDHKEFVKAMGRVFVKDGVKGTEHRGVYFEFEDGSTFQQGRFS